MESDQQSETSRVKVRRWSQSLTIKEQRLISKLNILLWRSAATQGDTDCREDSLYTLTTEPAGLSPISMLQTNIIIFIMCCFCSEYSTNWCSFLFCTNRKSNRLPLPVNFNKEKTKCFFPDISKGVPKAVFHPYHQSPGFLQTSWFSLHGLLMSLSRQEILCNIV